MLIGHGTFDGKDAKFNLRGPDVSDEELAQWLAPNVLDAIFVRTWRKATGAEEGKVKMMGDEVR